MLNLLDALAARQHGAAHRDQLIELDVPYRTVDKWVASGRLIPIHPSTYRLAGVPVTTELMAMAAVLAAGDGAALSHRSASHLWGLLRADLIEISVPRGRLPRLNGVIVHRSRDLENERIFRRNRIPTTSPMRAIADLGAVLGFEDVLDAASQGIADRRFGLAALETTYDRLGRRGRPGLSTFKRVLDELELLLEAPNDSVLEIRMGRLLRTHALPHFMFQHWVTGEIRVDFAIPELKLAIEVDGFKSRNSPRKLTGELDRQNELTALGWSILRFTWWRVVRQPAGVAADIRRQLGTYSAA